MIAPVRIWTSIVHAKPAKARNEREAKPARAKAGGEHRGWFANWERLWEHHAALIIPRFED